MLKKVVFLMLVAFFAVGVASAQQLAGQDILGPHNVNGHGCASCHAPHSGAKGNGGTSTATGVPYLWGRDFYQTTYTGWSGNTITIAATYAQSDPQFHTAACMSCHDGNQTAVVGMSGTSVETVEGGVKAPTYLAKDAEGLKNDHPVDVRYTPGGFNWPGTVDTTTGAITWTVDTATANFQASYGRPFRLYAGTGTAGVGSYVECSTCHNPHSVNYARSTFAGVANTVKPTNFFVRGWYNTDNAASNSGAQFCRSCHYSKSNEYVGQTVPTT